MTRWQARYRCQGCKHEWDQAAGPTQCPKCGHLYLDWLNYEELAKQ